MHMTSDIITRIFDGYTITLCYQTHVEKEPQNIIIQLARYISIYRRVYGIYIYSGTLIKNIVNLKDTLMYQ